MGVYEGIDQLDKAMKTLLRQWQEARALWDDAMSEKFEREHLDPLRTDLKKATAAMDRVAKAVAAVCRDCE
jgi:hypothetical protein